VRFIHLGAIATDQLPATYAQAHLHVMTSRTLRDSVEGFGLVYLEAAACGLTSIASNSGGCPDAVCDGETGVVVEEGNLPALMAAIEQMMTDSVLRQRLAAEARSRALEQTWEDSARAIVELTREG
jgi:glycosyltransferase involved in cell wall biosynthesis